MQRISLTTLFLSVVSVLPVHAAIPKPVTPAWTGVAPGVWKTTVGRADPLTLLGAAGGTPARLWLGRMPKAAFPIDPAEIEGRNFNARTAVRFPLGSNEDIYGLGVDFSSMRRNGGVFELQVDHWDSQRAITGRTHAPVPLYVSTKGFAVLFDTARYLKVTIGHGVRLAAKEKPPFIDRTTNQIMPTRPGEAPVKATW
ncbi:MAG: hypothetical protein SFU85_00740 [Candidatus Methylacidiphilales bacterium]|nr:hypothetical protein [Candidatus Methylacidiphilales bacterium]